MTYALVEDVAASWEQYARYADTLSEPPAGLILHAAGPTDEGFRIIAVWESQEAWEQFRAARLSPWAADTLLPPPLVRELRLGHVIYGAPRVADTPTIEGGHQ